MFRREDYWPYMFGVFVFAGLVAVPLIWGQWVDLPYGRLLAGSLVGCFVFAYAHTRDGQFSIGRFLMAFGLVFLFSLRIAAKAKGDTVAMIPGGLLGFLVMSGCGWLGIWIGRASGIAKALKRPDPTVLPTHEGKDAEPEAQSPADPTYSLGETVLTALFERTQQAWQQGQLAHLSGEFQKAAAGRPLEEFRKRFDPALNAIAFAFQRSAPDPDEFLVCAYDAQIRLSYVLTNKRFYFFGLDQGVLANKYESGKIALENIRSCVFKEGWVFTKASLTLQSGKTLQLKDLTSAEALKYIAKTIEAVGAAS